MTLEELFPEAVAAGLSLSTMPTLILDIPIEILFEAGIRLEESRWQASHIPGMQYRVDAERPEMKQQRHVHVAAEKHVKTPTRQASWNADGSRHDKRSFNPALGAQHAYQNVARVALGLSSDVILEEVELKRASKLIAIFESVTGTVRELEFRVSRPRRLKTFSEFIKKT